MFSLVYHLVAWKILLIGIPFSVVALAGSVPYVASTRFEVRPSWVSQSFFETRIWYDLWIQVCPRWHVETLDTAKGLASEVDYVPFQMRTNPQLRKTRKIKDYIIPPRLTLSSAIFVYETALAWSVNPLFSWNEMLISPWDQMNTRRSTELNTRKNTAFATRKQLLKNEMIQIKKALMLKLRQESL